jgi:hypothetical protein
MQILGFSMLATPFILMFIWALSEIGIKETLLIFLSITILAGWAAAAFYFIHGV